MRQYLLFVIIVLYSCGDASQTFTNVDTAATSGQSSTDPAVARRVDEIMAKMDLVDKVGEMTQLSIDMVSVGQPYQLPDPHRLDEEKLRQVLVEYRVGSILNAGGHTYTREHWYEIISTLQRIATEEKPSGIPILYGIDAIHGTTYTSGGTLMPQQIALAATYDTALVRRASEITAYETRASYIPWNFAPVLDIGRDQRWPRLWETFGEDVHLATAMGMAMTRGLQGESNDVADPEHVAACMKHFMGYSTPLSGKDRAPAHIPERMLREYFMPTFQAAIDAGAKTVMICSGEMNGIPVHADKRILVDILRNEMGFTGLAVTDWEDIGYLVTRHRVAKDYREAVKMAINAGIDMAMVPMSLDFSKELRSLVEDGEVPMSRIDEAVRRILTLKVEMGLFENPLFPPSRYPDFNSAEHQATSLEAAKAAMTLLKNEGDVLPLSKSTKVLVTGPTANSLNALNGGWTHTWQGAETKYNTPGKNNVQEALKAIATEANVQFVQGAEYDKTVDIDAAVAQARNSDVIVVCLGEMTYTELPGSITDITLPEAQHDLVEALDKVGKPMVFVMIGGRPRVFSKMEPMADAILMAYLPGDEGGTAIAETLYGDHNPAGRLPYTWPRHVNDLVTYDHKGTDRMAADNSNNGYQPQYTFGHGMSYTNFEYTNLTLSSPSLGTDGSLSVSVDVKNTGTRSGEETVLLFVRDEVATITPPEQRLRGFKKIDLAAGATKKVRFELSPRDLAFVGRDMQWVTEPGNFEVRIGGLTQSFEYVK